MSNEEQYAGVTFVHIDVDEAEDVAAECRISAMPTFQFYKGGQKIEEMMGADQNKLVALLAKHK
jgi:thioredoxin 1